MADPCPRRPTRRDPRLIALAEDSGYEIEGRIGAGGMGIVYRGRDADGNDVAIKLLRHEISDDLRARERLAREVAAQQRVRNDNIARILDAELDSGDAFVVTEFIPGPTLEEAVHSRGGIHPEAVRELGLVMGEALRDIHTAGVVHRDLKPSNVLLRGATDEDLDGFDPDGDRLDPVIIDFGIAIAAEESRLTSTGLVMGTAAYLDPEVVRTNHTGEQGDWWAWAALLAFAATGREPYGGGRADLVFLRAERGEIDVDGVPTELAQWLRSALQADPEQRPQPDELMERLSDLDLSYYDDPGPTEAIAAGTATALATAGAHVNEPHPDGGGLNDTQVIEPVPSGGAPTAALPVVGHDSQRFADPGRTAAAEPPTEAIPAHGPATEVLPVMGPPTQQMPAVHPDARHPGQHGAGPVQPAAPAGGYRVQRGPQPAPVMQHGGYTPTAAPPAQPGWPQAQPAHGQMTPPHGPMVPAHGQVAPVAGWIPPLPPPPRRPILVWTGHLLLVGLAAVAPYVSLLMLVILGALARTWERSYLALADRRRRGGTGSGALWSVAAMVPLRLPVAVLVILLQALLPLVLGILVGLATDATWTLLQGSPPPDGVVFSIAMTVTLLITWVGIGSRSTRYGAHRAVDAAAPDRVWGAVLMVLLLMLVIAVATTILARGGAVDYFPFWSGPQLDDVAIWRH